MRAISHRRVNSPQMQEQSNLPGNNFNLGLEMHETYWRVPSGNTSGCAGLAVSFYRSCNSLLTTTCHSLFSISVCCCGYDPVTPGPFCNPPHLCKLQRQCRASQSRCKAHCCKHWGKRAPFSRAWCRGTRPAWSCGAGHGRATGLHTSLRCLSPPLPWLNTDIHRCESVQRRGKFCHSICWGCLDEMYSVACAANVN